VIQIRHLAFGFVRPSHIQWICHDLSWRLSNTGIHLIEGASGRGKTTILHLLNQRLTPLKGRIQSRSSYPLMLTHPLYVHPGWRVEQYCQFFNLDAQHLHRLDLGHIPMKQRVETLSGGERVRFFLTLLLSQDGDVYFLDEPCSGLHDKHQRLVIDWIKEKSQHALCVIASHRHHWQPLASSHLKLLKNGETHVFYYHSSYQPCKQHTHQRRRRKRPHLPFKVMGQGLFMVGMSLSIALTIGLTMSVFLMRIRPMHYEPLRMTSTLVNVQTVTTIDLQGSPYVLTRTQPMDDRALYMLFQSQNNVVIAHDFRTLLPPTLHIDGVHFAVEWILDDTGHVEIIDVVHHTSQPMREWTWRFQVGEDETSLDWQWTFPFSIRYTYALLTPFDQPTIFLSYPQWLVFMASFYDTKGTITLLDWVREQQTFMHLGVFMNYPMYQTLKHSLEVDAIRLQHRWFDAFNQLVTLQASIEQWLVLLLLMNGLTYIFLEWARLQVWFAHHKDVYQQWRALGVRDRHLQATMFHPFWVVYGVLLVIGLVSVWIGIQYATSSLWTRLNAVFILLLVFFFLTMCLHATQSFYRKVFLR
jgi:ABC-type multidrug transport system ATPase subunit